jgi:hypothetical protein
VHFINRKKTIEEINAEKIKELQDALVTLVEYEIHVWAIFMQE